MKRYIVLVALLLGLAAFMFAQANSQAASPQSASPSASAPTAPADPDNLNAAPQDRDSRATAAQNPDYSQAPDQNRDARDRDRDQNRPDRDSANQDGNRDQVYDRDQTYQDQDRRDQQDRDRDANNNDVNRDRDSNRDIDRDRSRVVVGNDVQSQIYSALQNNRNLAGVNVDVRGDRINLTGTVPSGRDRKEALRIAQSYANGMRVDDHLSVGGRGHDNDRDDHR